LTELVLDASVLVMWFRRQGEGDLDAALAIRTAFQEGALLLFAPPLLNLELINLAGRRWRWNEDRLRGVASALSLLNLQWVEPELDRVATWTGRGLTAYDAAYVAVAEAGGLHLITADLTILATAPSIARPLATWN